MSVNKFFSITVCRRDGVQAKLPEYLVGEVIRAYRVSLNWNLMYRYVPCINIDLDKYIVGGIVYFC